MTQPIEYISFKNNITNWRYTNSNIVEQLGARFFDPLAYKRSEPVYSKDSSDGQVKIEVPSSIELISLYADQPSSFTTTVTIERKDRETPGSERIYWQGQIVSVQREGKFATLLAAPLTQVPSQVPRYTYSGLCNWVLFQDRCNLARQDWRHIGNVLSIENDTTFTVEDLSVQAAALDAAAGSNLTADEIANYWLGGYVETNIGEKRPIFQANVSGVPSRIRVLRPFTDLSVGNPVTVYAGCSRTRDICKRKFNNQLNHGGFPDIPEVNPFRTELPSGTTDPERKKFWGN